MAAEHLLDRVLWLPPLPRAQGWEGYTLGSPDDSLLMQSVGRTQVLGSATWCITTFSPHFPQGSLWPHDSVNCLSRRLSRGERVDATPGWGAPRSLPVRHRFRGQII